MSWGRIDDAAPEHKKWTRLEAKHGARAWAEATSVWFCVLCYANRNLTDGHISDLVLSRLTPLGTSALRAADRMVDVGLMDRVTGEESGYLLHDFLEYNDSAEHVRAKRKADADRNRARRRAKDGSYVQTDVHVDVQTDAARTNDGRPSTPSRPVPSRSPTESVDGAAPPPGPAIEERIERLAARYPSKLLETVHNGCKLSRTTGRMSDSKWLAALESFAVYDLAIAVRAMETFADRYADGSKGERYLLGIMRGERDQPAQRGLSLASSAVTREDAPDWHPTHGAPKSARNFDTWEAWINDGCPRDPAWKVAS